jgi:hypothetical protein
MQITVISYSIENIFGSFLCVQGTLLFSLLSRLFCVNVAETQADRTTLRRSRRRHTRLVTSVPPVASEGGYGDRRLLADQCVVFLQG